MYLFPCAWYYDVSLVLLGEFLRVVVTLAGAPLCGIFRVSQLFGYFSW